MDIQSIGRFVSACLLAFVVAPPGPAFATDATDSGGRDHDRPIVVTFTKWITTVVPPVPGEAMPSRFLMAGIVGGPLSGTFVGEVLDRKVSTTGTVTVPIVALDALYEVVAGDHSFTALIQGGQNNTTHKALLDGVILDGWRTGARVHVEFTVIATCAGKPAGPCFQGTITVAPDSED
jgi:hypothetical protein